MRRCRDPRPSSRAPADIKFYRFDGTTAVNERQEIIDAFSAPDGDVKVLLISTRAGGLGLNVVAADTVVMYDSDFNPQNDLQAQDRVHRVGQTRPVTVFRLVTRGTVDELVLAHADRKAELSARVLRVRARRARGGDGGRGGRRSLTRVRDRTAAGRRTRRGAMMSPRRPSCGCSREPWASTAGASSSDARAASPVPLLRVAAAHVRHTQCSLCE